MNERFHVVCDCGKRITLTKNLILKKCSRCGLSHTHYAGTHGVRKRSFRDSVKWNFLRFINFIDYIFTPVVEDREEFINLRRTKRYNFKKRKK